MIWAHLRVIAPSIVLGIGIFGLLAAADVGDLWTMILDLVGIALMLTIIVYVGVPLLEEDIRQDERDRLWKRREKRPSNIIDIEWRNQA